MNGGPGQTTALISGAVGVYALSGGGVTVVNYGTIAGQNYHAHLGEAVEFGAATDRLVVEAGSTCIEDVSGGGGTLELGSGKGTISGLGALGTVSGGAALTFVEFGSYAIDAGSSWSLTGTNTLAAAHGLTDAGTLGGNGTLALTGGAVTFNTGARLATLHVTMAGASTVTDAASLAYAGRWTQSGGTLSVAAGQTATFTGAADSFAGALAGAGTVAFIGGTDTLQRGQPEGYREGQPRNGATVTLSGAIANASMVSLTAGKLVVAAAGATLSGTGTVTLSDSAANLITGATAAARLTVGQILQGAGSLGGGTMTLTNLVTWIIRSEGAGGLDHRHRRRHRHQYQDGVGSISAGSINPGQPPWPTPANSMAHGVHPGQVEGAVSGWRRRPGLRSWPGPWKFTAASVFKQT